MPDRSRLPNRRPCVTERIEVGQSVYEVSIGFDSDGWPKEIFLTGAKIGTDMAAILADTSVAVSVALQQASRRSDGDVRLACSRSARWATSAPGFSDRCGARCGGAVRTGGELIAAAARRLG